MTFTLPGAILVMQTDADKVVPAGSSSGRLTLVVSPPPQRNTGNELRVQLVTADGITCVPADFNFTNLGKPDVTFTIAVNNRTKVKSADPKQASASAYFGGGWFVMIRPATTRLCM